MAETVSNNINELRQRLEATQEQLAHTVGVSRQTIIAMEKGNYVPSLLLALKVAKFFKKSVEDIFMLS